MTNLNVRSITDTVKAVFPDGEYLHKIKSTNKITTSAVIIALALSDADALESKGVYVNYELTNKGDLVALYIGLYGIGVVACYYTAGHVWHECQSHGNYGKNFASGGTWSTIKKGANVPQCVQNLIKAI